VHGGEVDLGRIAGEIAALTVRLEAIEDARELAIPLERLCNDGYGTALALDAESRRTMRDIVAHPADTDLELVRTLDALEVASRELRLSLKRLRARVDWLPEPAYSPRD
jgi:hypothetical protein